MADPASEWPRDCPFCRIVHGVDDARMVWEGELAVAFFPLSPATVGHCLVVPRQHVRDLWVADEGLAGQLMEIAIELGRSIADVVRPDGLNLITSAGEAASQSVFHLHLHVLPRWSDDDVGNLWPLENPDVTAKSEALFDAIRRACRATTDKP